MKICVTVVEAKEKGKIRNVVGTKAFRKNEFQLRFVAINP
jgi:hypothetical protein